MIVAGFGFRAAANAGSLRSAYELAASGHAVSALATAEDKARAASFRALAQSLDLPVHRIAVATIQAVQTLSESAHARRAHGTGSLAEASALAAAGPGARLLSPRHISQDRMATCAIAIGEHT